MRFQFGLSLLFIVLGALQCSSRVAADHFHLNKGAWVHRRGLLGDIVDIVDGDQPSSSSPSSTDPVSTPGTTSAVPPTSLSSDDLPSSSPTPTSTPGLLGLLLGDGSDPTPTTSSPAPSTSSAASGGLLPILDDLLNPGPSSSSTPVSSPTPSDATPSSSSSSDAGLLPILTPILGPSSSASGGLLPDILTPILNPSSATPAPSSSDSGGILPIITPILNPSSDSAPTPGPSSSDSGGILPIVTPILNPSSPPASTSSDSGGIIPIVTPILDPSTSNSGGILPIPTPIPDPSTSNLGGGQTTAIPPTSVLPLPLSPSSTDAPPPSPSGLPLASPSSPLLPTPGTSTDAPPPPHSLSSDPPLLASPTPAPVLPSTSAPSQPPPTSLPPTPPPLRPTPTSSISVNSDLSFILTESSLAVANLPSSTPTGESLTDPDAATTTVTNTQPLSNPTASSPLAASSDPSRANSQPPLPSGVPSRIYPPSQQVSPGATQADMEKEGYTLISLLFDQQLNWPFIVNSPIASSQLFALTPALIATAIEEPGDRVKTLFLQVFIPMSYTSPTDQFSLGTLFYGYIPSDKVDTLEAMIKAKQSKFYNGVENTAAKELAARVRSGWGVRGGPGDESSSSGGGGSSGGTGSGTTASQQKTRRDAIVGVVSSLGAIAVLVLIVLIVHSVKRKRELAHRRLADQASSLGSAGSDGAAAAVSGGRDFDRDSVGAPRRRSFYFAEDSLRGWEAERDPDRELNELGGRSPSSAGAMSQRRVGTVVVPGSISAPILRESSMNW